MTLNIHLKSIIITSEITSDKSVQLFQSSIIQHKLILQMRSNL